MKAIIERNPNLTICGILFFCIFVLKYPVDYSEVIYGGNYIIQFLPWLQEVSNNLALNLYPFFSFDINFGQDILAESQQAVGHPIKLLLLTFFEAWQANTIFFIFHIVLLFYGMYLLLSKYVDKATAIIISIICITNISLILNTAHPFFICVLAYFPYQLLILERFEATSSFRKNLLLLTVVTSFSLLCGHFQLQFFTLFAILFYSFFQTKKSPYILLLFLVSTALAFLISSFQLLPTLGLILESSRSGAGGLNKFVGSASPLTWFNYLTPSLGWEVEKFSPDVPRMLGRHILIENTHYIGLFPIVAILAVILERKKTNKNDDGSLSLLIVLYVVKAMGVFLFINFILNFLPIFGQFRIPARNLFILDILLLLYLAVNIDRISISGLENSFKIISCMIILISLASIGLVFFGFQISNLEFQHQDLVMLSLPLFLILVLYCLFKFLCKKKVLLKNIVFSLLTLTVLEVIAIGNLIPTYHYNISGEKYEASQKQLDEFCAEGDILLNDLWEDFNKPIFWGSGINERYIGTDTKKGFPLNGYDCNLNHELSSSTITQEWIRELDSIFRSSTLNERAYIANLLGFDLIDSYKKQDQMFFIKKIAVNGNSANSYLDKTIFEIINRDSRSKTLENLLSEQYFRIFSKWNAINFLPRADINAFTLNDSTFLPLVNSYTYKILDNDGQFIQYDNSKSLVKLETNLTGSVNVIFIPVLFISGLILSLIGMISLTLFSALRLNLSNRFYLRIIERLNLSDGFRQLGIAVLRILNKYSFFLNLLSVFALIVISFFCVYLSLTLINPVHIAYLNSFLKASLLYFVFFLAIYLLIFNLEDLKLVRLPILSFIFLNYCLGQVICIFLAITPLYVFFRNFLFSIL